MVCSSVCKPINDVFTYLHFALRINSLLPAVCTCMLYKTASMSLEPAWYYQQLLCMYTGHMYQNEMQGFLKQCSQNWSIKSFPLVVQISRRVYSLSINARRDCTKERERCHDTTLGLQM